ncbi:MAG TPA: PilZ domain-containing protein [bacterium]
MDRRKHKRKTASIEVEYIADGSFFTGFSKDISTGGIFIITSNIFKPGEKIFVDFYLPGVKHKFKLNGKVVKIVEFSNDGSVPGMEVEFFDMREDIKDILESFVILELDAEKDKDATDK